MGKKENEVPGRNLFVIASFIFVVVFVSACCGVTKPSVPRSATNVGQTMQSSETSVLSDTPVPTGTPEPTNTLGPTITPSPTTTVSPEDEEYAEEAYSLIDAIEKEIGAAGNANLLLLEWNTTLAPEEACSYSWRNRLMASSDNLYAIWNAILELEPGLSYEKAHEHLYEAGHNALMAGNQLWAAYNALEECDIGTADWRMDSYLEYRKW
jgi:hypothetical protein